MPVPADKTKRKANIARTNSKDKAKGDTLERKRSKSAEKSLEKTCEEVDELRQSQLIQASTSFLAGITGQAGKPEPVEEEPPVKVKEQAKAKEEELESSRTLESSRKETKRAKEPLRESGDEVDRVQTKSLEDKYARRLTLKGQKMTNPASERYQRTRPSPKWSRRHRHGSSALLAKRFANANSPAAQDVKQNSGAR